LADEGLEGHVGVATGHCWCGVVGGESRREYTVLGDVVNLSARLMGKAAINGVLVDSTTKEMASQVLQFEDGGELTLKGKAAPVQAFRFVGLRRGLSHYRVEVNNSPLLSWHGWPAHPGLMHALDGFKNRSGVLFITGPGGAGKTELSGITQAWAKSQGWKLLSGQNMDPTGIFSVPRLPLQEAFRELMRVASQDPFWRSCAQDLIRESLGRKPMNTDQERADPERRRRSETSKKLTAQAPRFALLITAAAAGAAATAAASGASRDNASAWDDECSANSEEGVSSCALSALQRRRLVKSGVPQEVGLLQDVSATRNHPGGGGATPCWRKCGRKEGWCPQFCHEGQACCTFYRRHTPECKAVNRHAFSTTMWNVCAMTEAEPPAWVKEQQHHHEEENGAHGGHGGAHASHR